MLSASYRTTLATAIVLCSVLSGGCDPLSEPEAPSSFGVPPTPTPVPVPPPPPTPAPPGTPAPPLEKLTAFLSQCPDPESTRITLYQFSATATDTHGTRFHQWRVLRSRSLSHTHTAGVLSWLKAPSTYFPDDCMCSSEPPDFGFRISCSGARLDLVLDTNTLRVLGSDDHRTINERVHGSFVHALEHAIRTGA